MVPLTHECLYQISFQQLLDISHRNSAISCDIFSLFHTLKVLFLTWPPDAYKVICSLPTLVPSPEFPRPPLHTCSYSSSALNHIQQPLFTSQLSDCKSFIFCSLSLLIKATQLNYFNPRNKKSFSAYFGNIIFYKNKFHSFLMDRKLSLLLK